MEEIKTEVTPEQTVESTDTSVQEPVQADTSTETEPIGTESEATNEAETETEAEQETPEWLNKSKYKTVEEQAKAYSKLESKATKDAIELANLRKKMDELATPKEPQIIDEKGNISKEFQESYQFKIDSDEFVKYDSLSRNIPDLAVRQEVEDILRQAQSVYHYDKSAYAQTMDTLKQYFSPRIIEQITRDKILAEQQLNSYYQDEMQKSRHEKVKAVAERIDNSPELKQLIDTESEDYSPETFTIIKQLFDGYGTIDTDLASKAISSIKALGVKEHLAKQKLEATKQSATVPTGTNVNVVKSDMPTAQDFAENPSLYTEAVKKYGMEKVDAIIAGKTI